MNLLIAPNSMKGSLSALRFAKIIENAFQDIDLDFFNIRKIPIADGGDHTADILISALKLANYSTKVSDPLGRTIEAGYGYADGLAVIEMANASGLKLLKPSGYNPFKTSSFGTGQLILEVINREAKRILIGVGGSATVDGGMGMLEALGIQFYDINDGLLSGNGENMGKVKRIDRTKFAIPEYLETIVLADVGNYLLGKNGAAQVFGPQKGADPAMVKVLESNLNHFAEVIRIATGCDITKHKGRGAAGGLAASLVAFLGASISAGSEYILDLVSINSSIDWADWIITGEGRIDRQTTMDKAPYALAKRAKLMGKPVVVLAGSGENPDQDLFHTIFQLRKGNMTIETAIENAETLCYEKAQQLAILLKNGELRY